jgi:hypothetical protein
MPSQQPLQENLCPYCFAKVGLVDSAVVYSGHSYGPLYLCSNWPQCDAYVGCHKGTTKPLGRLANKQLREWKIKAHAALDELWKSKRYSRHHAYQIASDILGKPFDETHIGMFDVQNCKDLIRALQFINPNILIP